MVWDKVNTNCVQVSNFDGQTEESPNKPRVFVSSKTVNDKVTRVDKRLIDESSIGWCSQVVWLVMMWGKQPDGGEPIRK
jgi:hypothetical protein